MRSSMFLLLAACCFSYSATTAATINIVKNTENEVSIHFSDTSYAGQHIVLLTDKHPFLDTPDTLSSMFSEDGNFTFTFSLDQIQHIYFTVGVYTCHLYTVPGNSYHIKVPPFRGKSMEEQVNPFFNHQSINLYIIEKTNKETGETFADASTLNAQLYQSEAFYQELSSHITPHLRIRMPQRVFDSIYLSIKTKHHVPEHPFIQEHMAYRIAYLRSIAQKYPSSTIAREYFVGKPLLFHVPGYKVLFQFTFKDYLHTLVSTPGNNINAELMKEGAVCSQLHQHLQKEHLLDDSLKQLVLLTTVMEEKNRNNFEHKALDALLDSLIYSDWTIIPGLSSAVKSHLNHLRAGSNAPEFKFRNAAGDRVTKKDFAGHFVYLGFCNLQHFECARQLRLLDGFHQRFEGVIRIVMVLTDPYKEVQNYARQAGHKWDVVHWDNCQSCLDNYRIRAYPSYYFLDKDGTLLYAPAPSPNEYFESQLFRMLRAARKI